MARKKDNRRKKGKVTSSAVAENIEPEHNPENEISTEHNPENEISTEHNPENEISTEHNPENEISTEHNPENVISTGHNPENEISTEHEEKEDSEDVMFSLDQVVDAARECHQDIGTLEIHENEENSCPEDMMTKEMMEITNYDEDTITDLDSVSNECPEDAANNLLEENEESPGLLNISIAPLENLKQKQTDNYPDDSENLSQESVGYKGLIKDTTLQEETKNENGPVVKLVSVNEVVTSEFNRSLNVHQPVTKEESAFFKQVAETDDIEYLKNLVIGQNNAAQQIFGYGNEEDDEGCLTQHYVTYTSLDDGTQEIKTCQVEDFQSSQVLRLPSGEVVRLEDETMNFVTFVTQSGIESESQQEQGVEKDVKSPQEILHSMEGLGIVKNFACDLCPEAFEKKLQLNNHKDKRHGVKFVFTEKGKKVKLVRLPKDFEYRGGERLDPCVQLLLDAMKRGGNENQGHGAIGVQIVEELEKPETQMHILGPDGRTNSADTDEVDENWDSYTCGFLIDAIKTGAIEKTKLRKQTPFVAFYPHDADSSFILRIDEVSEDKNLLVPASSHDVVNAEGAELERVSYIHDTNQEAGSSREVTAKCKRDYKIPIVATCHQILDEDSQRYMILVNDPSKDNPVQKIQFIEVEKFRKYAQQCQGKKVRTLHEATNPMPPPKPRKPYQRRAARSLAASANVSQVATTSIHGTHQSSQIEQNPQVEQKQQLDQIQETPFIAKDKIIRSRRCIKKEFLDPDELQDPSYEPKVIPRIKPTSVPSASGTGRKRGRPRKVVPEGLEEYPPKSQKRGAKKRKDLTELIKAVETIMKKEKSSDGYDI